MSKLSLPLHFNILKPKVELSMDNTQNRFQHNAIVTLMIFNHFIIKV